MQFFFQPQNFIWNLRYMILGMLGIFIAIGMIVMVTMLLNIVTNRK